MIRVDQFYRILELVPEDFYVFCETQGNIYPINYNIATYNSHEAVEHRPKAYKYIPKNGEPREDYFIFREKLGVNNEKVNRKEQILLSKMYGSVSNSCIWLNTSCLEIQESINPVTVLESKRELNRLNNYNIIHSRRLHHSISILHNRLPREYSIDKCLESISTTYIRGIGLNKREIIIDGKTIIPGKALIIDANLYLSNTICDLSLLNCENKNMFPRKYTKLLMNLRK